ncbi:hypothetical protein IFM89_002451 [Coptis chinensis]|uniref:Uncharacterized protein n=1 Tax=Coptis chinensis TaxID=261450 RepID=A0A835IJ67_9MAGN|nr:hypothetical protein IFM89_002451 [Coptis chinensis]
MINNKILPSISVTKNRDRGSIESVNMGEVISKLYLCENFSLVNDRCFAITFDRTPCVPLILACRKGRTSIEDQAEKFLDIITKVPIGVFKGITKAAKVTGGLDPKAANRERDLCVSLFIGEDPRAFFATKADLNHIGLANTLRCMMNGARLVIAMATMDVIKLHRENDTLKLW